MNKYKINNIIVEDSNMKTVLQLCNSVNINIPKFCYHDQLSIAGNCRMCLVEVKGSLKPVASCASPLLKDMHILTNTKLVKKAREGVLEFLLLNHPLDCPICDQGGECDLQDQSLIFGNDRGRFYENKRSVNDKNCGPLIKTIMTRCIHCTRCIRFIDEFIGYKYFGLIGRGQNIEISNFLIKNINSEVSGNLIDLCPVGALTSKPYSFISRPWELISWNTIDINDPMHVNIRVDMRDTEILRILPIFNNILKEVWISDITRFSYDSYKNNRILTPLKKKNENKFIQYSWENILELIFNLLKKRKINFLIGENIDCETGLILKLGKNYIGSSLISNTKFNNRYSNNNKRENYLLSYNIFNSLNNFKNILIIDLNMRLEYPLLNLRIKKLKDLKIIKVYNIGSSYNSNYNSINYYNNSIEIKKICEGRSFLNNILLKEEKNLILSNSNNSNINLLKNIINFLNIKVIELGVLNNSSVNIIKNELNLNNSLSKFNDYSYIQLLKNNSSNILYCLNTYNINLTHYNINIFQGNFLPRIKEMNLFDILLPSVTIFEKIGLYINLFGYCQSSKYIIFPPKNCRNDWKILYILFRGILRKNFSFKYSINKLRFLLKEYYNIHLNNVLLIHDTKIIKKNIMNIDIIKNKNFYNLISNHYSYNKFLKSSKILTTCLINYKKIYNNFH